MSPLIAQVVVPQIQVSQALVLEESHWQVPATGCTEQAEADNQSLHGS